MKKENLKPDISNANKGTVRGQWMLEKSIEETGLGRSILADKNGNIIAGNKTYQTAMENDMPVQFIEADGKTLTVVIRKDLDLNKGDKARKLAYYDNRVAQVDLDWDASQMIVDVENGVALDNMWVDGELDSLLSKASELDIPKMDTEANADDFSPSGIQMLNVILDKAKYDDMISMLTKMKEEGSAENTSELVYDIIKNAYDTSR